MFPEDWRLMVLLELRVITFYRNLILDLDNFIVLFNF